MSAQHIYEKREGSGAGSGAGSVPLTNGSGSGSRRPKNMRILRIRIPNTDIKVFHCANIKGTCTVLQTPLYSTGKSDSKK
jgi:hypothetical protein